MNTFTYIILFATVLEKLLLLITVLLLYTISFWINYCDTETLKRFNNVSIVPQINEKAL